MSIVGLLCLLFALVATLLFVLYWLQRRELASVGDLSQQLQRIAIGGRLEGRLELPTDRAEVSALVTAVNHLLTRATSPGERDSARASPKMFADLGDRIHEAVLVHRDVILYANRQFASFVGVDRIELVGRRLGDLVPPEYAELVNENIRRRLAGEEAAARYEIEMIGLQGQVSRLEITSGLVDYEGAGALLITGVEIIPTQTVRALRLETSAEPSPHLLALNSLAEAIITTDAEGRITYMNRAAELLSGGIAEQVAGKPLEDIIGLVDETDRRLLADPVKQAFTSGAPVNLSRRALLVSRGEWQRALHRIVSFADPQRGGGARRRGGAAPRRDRAARACPPDVLPGDARCAHRAGQPPRVRAPPQEAIDSGHRGDGQHVLCYLDLDRFKVVNDTSGHVAGDSMLREVAKILRDAVRDSDTVGAPGRRRVRHAARGVSAGEGAPDRGRRCRACGDYPFRLEGQDIQHRGLDRPGRDLPRERHTGGAAGRRRLRLLRRQEQGSGRVVGLFGAR